VCLQSEFYTTFIIKLLQVDALWYVVKGLETEKVFCQTLPADCLVDPSGYCKCFLVATWQRTQISQISGLGWLWALRCRGLGKVNQNVLLGRLLQNNQELVEMHT